MNFDAFKEAPWFSPNFNVIVGGLGNIGSWTSLLLSRMGYTMYLYDMDVVEVRNVGSQFYGLNDLNKKKTEAMTKYIMQISGNNNVYTMEKYDENGLVDNIMISCFDNMAARKIMFEKWLDFQLKKPSPRDPKQVNIFIDGRSLAEIGTVFVVKSPLDAEKYRETLFEDQEAEGQLCSYKSTSHNGAMIASMIMSVLANHIANKLTGEKLREVPFKIDYQLPLMRFET